MAENVKVIVRCRPMNKKEKELNCQCIVKMKNCIVETWDPQEGPSFPKQFTFDSVYDQDSNTEQIYNDICYPLVESVLEGYNSTIFVYGQTGCGKSFTMEGNKMSSSCPSSEKGIISRTFEHIFEAISVTSGVKYLALVSYLEIYNEQIRDLLLPNDKISTLSLKEVTNEGITVPGLTQQPVHNIAECEQLLNIGSKNRMIGATLMNQSSSRSHSIFTISIEQISNLNNNESIRKGKLNLVDLAGSERQAKTGATGDRLKEATKINLSLSALGNVISALVDGKAKHIPYRDSKLTRLLQDSLGGNTRTLMIACVSPASRDYVETLSTLRYANRAKNIHNKPRVNEDPKDAMLRTYQEEIQRLKALLENRVDADANLLKIEDLIGDADGDGDIGEINDNVRSENAELDAKRDSLIEQYEKEMAKLKSLHENEKTEKEKIMKQIETIRTEYEENLAKLNNEHKAVASASTEEILKRIETLKAAMIGGEKVNDKELSEKRKRKKLAAERRLSAIAHVLAKIDMNEDREILQNEYKDISQELQLKTEALRKYRMKVRSLEKEIKDIQSEFEAERQDYLETIRKQDKNIKLLSQISEKISGTLKKECNYKNLENIKEQAVWSEDAQKYRLPELTVPRTKLPPAGQNHNRNSTTSTTTTATTREYEYHQSTNGYNNYNANLNGHKSNPTSPPSLTNTHNFSNNIQEEDKNERDVVEDFADSYFRPKRAAELLTQSQKLESDTFNAWRGTLNFTEFARRTKPRSTECLSSIARSPNMYNNHYNNNNGINSWFNDANLKKPLRLEALPSMIDSIQARRRIAANKMDF